MTFHKKDPRQVANEIDRTVMDVRRFMGGRPYTSGDKHLYNRLSRIDSLLVDIMEKDL